MSMRLSKSKINKFLECPRQFKYIYINHMDTETNDAAQLGLNVHEIADKFIKNDTNLNTYDTIFNKLLEYQSEYEDDYTEQCENLAKFFYQMLVQEDYTFFSAEEDIINEEYNFKGLADLVLKDKEGKLFVVDYKTGRSSSVKKYKLELCYYKMLIEGYFKGEEVTKAAIYFTKDGILSSMEFSNDRDGEGYCSLDDYNFALRYIDTMRLEIEEEHFPARRTDMCKFCDFPEECAKDSGFREVEL